MSNKWKPVIIALFFPFEWLLWRKLYLYFFFIFVGYNLISFITIFSVALLTNDNINLTIFISMIIRVLLFVYGKKLYLTFVSKKILKIKAAYHDIESRKNNIQKSGGINTILPVVFFLLFTLLPAVFSLVKSV
ncbi:DUF2628 domain-containing protein [Ureibacillus sp. Re31]|uniref:DUF2628 domain-containing protein n=2 Tax=Ureibacillus galli TaxID=2762222 RepID=A0ABR8XAI5_9BACL|nr:DUF2628 domain-containing protein [Ureibacillus galli]MBD8026340.1 DUF2628 domain-containing protein [Ureibacillus galli]